MISTAQIVAAGTITAVGVAIASAVVGWRLRWIVPSAVGAFFLIIAWRALSNALGLNGDFIPAISVGDVICLFAGSIAPAALSSAARVPDRFKWLPAIIGALVGFVVNVVIL